MNDLQGSGGRNDDGAGGFEDYRGGSGAGTGAGRGEAGPRTKLLYVTPEKLAKSGSLAATLKTLASRCHQSAVDGVRKLAVIRPMRLGAVNRTESWIEFKSVSAKSIGVILLRYAKNVVSLESRAKSN